MVMQETVGLIAGTVSLCRRQWMESGTHKMGPVIATHTGDL